MKTKQYGIIAVSVFLTLGIVSAFGMNTESFLTSIYNTADSSANVSFTAGTITETVSIGSGASVNTGLNDADTTIAGDTDAALLYIDAGNDRVGVSTATPDTQFHQEFTSALTNTVSYQTRISHETSGVPANGIGIGLQYEQETSAANNEIIMTLDAVVDDATAGNEDASFSVKLMEAGAVAAEKFAIESTGIVTLVGGTTLDNDTSVTDLNITEDSVTITGDFETTGTATLGGDLVLEGADEITNAVAGTIILDAVAVETTGTLETTGTATLGGNLILEGADEITNAVAGTIIIDAAAVETTGTLETTGTATLGGDLILESADEITNAAAGTIIIDAAAVETTGTLETTGAVQSPSFIVVDTTEGTGALTLATSTASSGVLTGATDKIEVDIPSGALLHSCQLRVDVAVTNAGDNTWAAAYSGGANQAIASAATAAAKNTKVNTFFDANGATAITSGETDITLTPQGADFTAGEITAVCYYYTLTALTDAP